MLEQTDIGSAVRTEVEVANLESDVSHPRISEIADEQRDSQGVLDNEIENKQFDAQDTFRKLMDKVSKTLEKHSSLLSKMTKNDFDVMTQIIQNNPGTGDMLRLASRNFEKWGKVSEPGVQVDSLQQMAVDMQSDIEAMEDSDFFGDLEDVSTRRAELNKLAKNAVNSKLGMVATIIQQQVLKRSMKY